MADVFRSGRVKTNCNDQIGRQSDVQYHVSPDGKNVNTPKLMMLSIATRYGRYWVEKNTFCRELNERSKNIQLQLN